MKRYWVKKIGWDWQESNQEGVKKICQDYGLPYAYYLELTAIAVGDIEIVITRGDTISARDNPAYTEEFVKFFEKKVAEKVTA